MSTPSFPRRAALLLLCCPLAFAMAGSDSSCSFSGLPIFDPDDDVIIVDDFVTVELVNNTGFLVDPGLFVSGELIIIDPPLDPGELLTLDIDCFLEDVLEVDATLLLPDADLLAVNVPVLEEGISYLCGDIVTFFFEQDITGQFFVEVAVNDVLLP